jgi:hypothetical protein
MMPQARVRARNWRAATTASIRPVLPTAATLPGVATRRALGVGRRRHIGQPLESQESRRGGRRSRPPSHRSPAIGRWMTGDVWTRTVSATARELHSAWMEIVGIAASLPSHAMGRFGGASPDCVMTSAQDTGRRAANAARRPCKGTRAG